MKRKTIQVLNICSLLIIFAAFASYYLSVKLWDYDFWWHIATGRYIVETGSIPNSDPFSYTSELDENKNLFQEREQFILKQYWLAQVIFYLIYHTFGDIGIIILRCLLLLLVIFAVYWGLKKEKAQFYIIFPFVFLTYFTTSTYSGERPVLFTILFSVLSFLLLDGFRKDRSKAVLLLIPLMLLWANMHGGFIIGCVIIATFIIGETLNIRLKRSVYTKQELFLFYFATFAAIAVSMINPNGFDAFLISFSPEYKLFEKNIQEYKPIYFLYWNKARSLDIGYLILLTLTPIILIFRARKMDIIHISILLGLLIMSIIALRYMIYYVVIGAIIIGKETNYLIEKLFEHKINLNMQKVLPQVFAVIIFFSSIMYLIGQPNFKEFKFEKATRYSVPENAVNFIESNPISGNIYNDFGFGGYLSWRLYPLKKNFVDTRSLNLTTVTEYGWIIKSTESIRNNKLPEGKSPLWERLLSHYNVDLILLSYFDPYGTVPQLLLSLTESNKWVPVYLDVISVIFVRNSEKNTEIIKKFRLPKDIVYDAMILQTTRWATIKEDNPFYLISLGDIFHNMNRMDDAVNAYEYALRRFPHNHSIRLKLEQIKKETELQKL